LDIIERRRRAGATGAAGTTRAVGEVGDAGEARGVAIAVRYVDGDFVDESSMHPATEPPDPAEPDLYWAGHSGWAMLPSLVVGAMVSAIIMLGAPPVGNLIGLPSDWTAFLTFWLVLLGWIGAAIDWSYRGAAFVYRLTPRRLYADFGMLYRPVPPIPLTDVTNIEHRAWALRRLFGVGSVIVHAKGRPPLRLRGIFRPDRFADAIRTAVRQAQAEHPQIASENAKQLTHPVT